MHNHHCSSPRPSKPPRSSTGQHGLDTSSVDVPGRPSVKHTSEGPTGSAAPARVSSCRLQSIWSVLSRQLASTSSRRGLLSGPR
ncbi:hypothetical protein OH76DRAFT_1208575 [Lentinus brumalis]|uniref:Uncharacterized protein n=1 Tax=Lentinus brumalis TaxID=2498619 RepID=A0A371DL69_9APHY|nr:hypothetical protein OH76DRAFT_1208575 [Polyporus brumalis]